MNKRLKNVAIQLMHMEQSKKEPDPAIIEHLAQQALKLEIEIALEHIRECEWTKAHPHLISAESLLYYATGRTPPERKPPEEELPPWCQWPGHVE